MVNKKKTRLVLRVSGGLGFGFEGVMNEIIIASMVLF